MTGVRLALFAACLVGAVPVQEAFAPARYLEGALPPLPVFVVGGGEVLLDVSVDSDGRVTSITPLRVTPPFTDFVVDAVRGWRFLPARTMAAPNHARPDQPPLPVPVASQVLVAGVFRAPTLWVPTLGELPRDVGVPSGEIPFPVTTTPPPYPPQAFCGGVVLVEVPVAADGTIGDVTVIRSAPPFDEPARSAARQWTFRPGRVEGTAVPALVYVIFGFPAPVSDAARRAPAAPASRAGNPSPPCGRARAAAAEDVCRAGRAGCARPGR
jgi:TonB family protein